VIAGIRGPQGSHIHDDVLLECFYMTIIQATGSLARASRFTGFLVNEGIRDDVIIAGSTPTQI